MGIRHARNHGQSPDLATAGLQPRSRAGTWPVDPTDLKVRVLNIDGVRYELLSPPNAKMLGGVRVREQLRHQRPCEVEGYTVTFLCSDRIQSGRPVPQLPTPEVSCHASSRPPSFKAPSCPPLPPRGLHSPPRHWVRTSPRRPGTGKPLPTPNRRP